MEKSFRLSGAELVGAGPAGWSDTSKCTICGCPGKLIPAPKGARKLKKSEKKLAPWAEWLLFLHTSTPRL